LFSTSGLASQATARQKRDQSIAMILVLIVVVFTSCNVQKIIVNLYEVRFAMIMILVLIVVVFTSDRVLKIIANQGLPSTFHI
jgi:uncharacterized integral membrane protein